MTFISSVKEKKTSKFSSATFLCVLVLAVMLYFSDSMKSGILYGIKLCFSTIIPTLFPFFILSDLWSSQIVIDKNGTFARIFKRVFRINGIALPSFFLGSVCGFPLGVRSAAKLYENKLITKDELERLIGVANNPSCAFVISGIGAGIYGDVFVGVRLYFAVILSAILVGIFFRGKTNIYDNSYVISRQSFNLVDSIKNAGLSSITISSYIIFFCAIINSLSKFIKSRLAVAILSSLLEITNASILSGELDEKFFLFRLPITAFALGFSGFSVHLQSFSLLPKEISKTRYLIMKLLQGLICFFITFIFLLIVK